MLVLLLIALPLVATGMTFAQAKKLMYQIYEDNPVTLYCGCTFKNKQVNWDSCGYEVRKNLTRARRVEAEHIVPAAEFGKSLQCWQEPICVRRTGTKYKGRACCEKINPKFRAMYTDLRNLAVAIGEINGDRLDYPFGIATGQGYGACEMLIDRQLRIAYPPERSRGLIARTYLYMQATYGLALTPEQQTLYQEWDERYPKSDWEITRETKIAQLQAEPVHLAGG